MRLGSYLSSIFYISKTDLILSLLGLTLFITLIPILTYLYFSKDLSSKESIMNRNDTGVILLDKNGTPFFNFYQAKVTKYVPLSEVSDNVTRSLIISEDQDFFNHPGFSLKSILRSLVWDLKNKDTVYGGSTITQQLVKNSLLHPQRSFLRKYQEVVLASELERRYSKQEILEMYLNSVYFGRGSFGIEAAAENYFGKNASQLDLSEASFLIAILPSPSKLDLPEALEDVKKRQEIILQRMVDHNQISKEQKDTYLKKELKFISRSQDLNTRATHFALMVINQLIDEYGEEQIERSGFKVKTSIDLEWQKYAEEVVLLQVKELAANRVTNGSTVVIDPKTGEVRVLVGSYDWYDNNFGKVNIATSLRPPGSSFKPIVYAAALEQRLITPATLLHDQPITYTVAGSTIYKPLDYDRKFRGQVLVRRALANSLNIPAVEVMNKVGVPKAIEMAQRLGLNTLRSPEDYGLALVLGAAEVKLIELTNVYATFANNGNYTAPVLITDIQDKYGKSMYQYHPNPRSVISADITYLITSILSDKNTRSEVFGNALNTIVPAAVKTGTTEDYKDALTLGYNSEVAIGVWVGNNDNKPMDNIAGSLGAAPIWKLLIERFSTNLAQLQSQPNGVISKDICLGNGLLVNEATTSGVIKEYFLKGSEPTRGCFTPKPTPLLTDTTPKDDKNSDGKGKDKKQ